MGVWHPPGRGKVDPSAGVAREIRTGGEGEKMMDRLYRLSSLTGIFHSAVLLVSWSTFGPAIASWAGAVGFPRAVAQALRNNAGLSAAGYEWTAARKEAQAARGNYLPKLTFEERFVRTNIPAEAFAIKLNEERLLPSDFADVRNFNQTPPINEYLTSFTLEQPIFAPRAYLGYEMARREASATGLDVSRKKEETVFQVLTAYLSILTAKEVVRVAEQGLSDAREHHRIAEVMEKAGMGLTSDVLRAKVFLASAESGKVTAESRLALARTALGLAIGKEGGARVDASAPVPSLPETGTLEERIAAVRANRFDLRAFSLRLAKADTNVTLRKSDYLPTIGAMGAYQIDGQDGIFSPDNRTWKVGVGLTWNLFDGLRREAEVAKASAERGKAREHYRGADDRPAGRADGAKRGAGRPGRGGERSAAVPGTARAYFRDAFVLGAARIGRDPRKGEKTMTGKRRRTQRIGRPAGKFAARGIGIFLLAGIVAGMAGCGEKGKHGPATAERPLVTGVELVTAGSAPRERFGEAVGTIRANNIAAVAPQVMGRVTSLPVAEGVRVGKGALLATIDDTQVRAQLAAAEAMVAEAEGGREEAERSIAQAEAGKSLAEKTYERFRKLNEEKVITPQEFDEVEVKRTVAVKEYERSLTKRAQAAAKIAQAKAQADAARAMLSYTRVTAPFPGVVTEKRADAGSMAVPGVPIVVLEDTGRYRP